MQAREIISHDESKCIIEEFFKCNFDLKELLRRHKSKHTYFQLTSHVKKVFRKLILDLEYELLVSGKIKTLQLAENRSDEMFNRLLRVDKILTNDEICNLSIYYRNRVSRVTVYQTDLIDADRRLAIYHSILNYAIDNDLFRFCISDPHNNGAVVADKNKNFEYVKDPLFLYTSDALELLYQSFVEENGDVRMVERRMRKHGQYTSSKYAGEMLHLNLKNLFLIGLYRIYKAAARSRMKPCYSWQAFLTKYVNRLETFTAEWLKKLLRIAVYDNPRLEEQIQISAMINKKYDIGRSGYELDRQARNIKDDKRKRDFMYSKIRQEMIKILNRKRNCITVVDQRY